MLTYFKVTSDTIMYLPYSCGLCSKLLTLLLVLLLVSYALKGVESNSPELEQLKFSLGMDSRGDAVLSHLLGMNWH